ncbi:Rgg family transcriptional regulator [Lactovum odontotermitis]
MKKRIDPKIGQLVKTIKDNKKLTLKQMTGGKFSESMLTRLEKGENSISVEKFFTILSNSQIFLDEFQHLYNDYEATDDLGFQREMAIAYARKDIKKLKSLVQLWEVSAEVEETNKFIRINRLVSRAVLALAQKSKPLVEDVRFLADYLDSVDDWGRYELWIFGNCLYFFDKSSLQHYGEIILNKTKFYKSLHINQQMVIRMLLNLVDAWLRYNELWQARKYLNHVKEVGISIDFFYERILLVYHEAHYRFLQGNESGKEEMRECANTIERYGFAAESEILFVEIENL